MELQHHRFQQAVDALIQGDVAALAALLQQNPALAHARAPHDHQATLLHYVAANGVEAEKQRCPPNAVEIARTLLEAGVPVDAPANFGGNYGPHTTPLVGLVSSFHPYVAGVQVALVKVLVEAGANVHGVDEDDSPLGHAIAFGYTGAARQLVALGARISNLGFAAAVGTLDQVQAFFDAEGQPLPEAGSYQGGAMRLGNTPQEWLNWAFYYACMHGQLTHAAYLLKRGADIHAQGHEGMTPLHLAVTRDKHELCAFLLAHRADTEVVNDYGGTVLDYLAWAVQHQQAPPDHYMHYVYTLLSAGADPLKVDPVEATFPKLQREILFFQALACLDRGDLKGLNQRLKAHPWLVDMHTLNPEPPYQGYFTQPTLLHHVAGNPTRNALPENIVEITRALLGAGAPVDAVCGGNWTPLGLVASGKQALERGYAHALADALLEAGADVNAQAGLNLYAAIYHVVEYPGQKEMARYLREKGAAVDFCYAAALGERNTLSVFWENGMADAPGVYGRYRPPGDEVEAPSSDFLLGEALLYACLNGQQAAISWLLEKGAPLQGLYPVNGVPITPLHAAVWGGWLDAVILLTGKGADINFRDPVHNSSPIGWAAFLQKEEIRTYLLADPSRLDLDNAVEFAQLALARALIARHPGQVNGHAGRGSPLRIAAFRGFTEIVSLLLESGADPNLPNNEGSTALDYARAQGHTDIVEILLHHGGKPGTAQ